MFKLLVALILSLSLSTVVSFQSMNKYSRMNQKGLFMQGDGLNIDMRGNF